MTDFPLIAAAVAGDERAFGELVEPHRRPLHAHCYRMLGSLQDAEDAVQETLLRAWRSLSSFRGRSSLRAWLYMIATNVCLRAIERRPSRVLPIDYGPAADPHEPTREPLLESVWIEPYPDEQLGLDDGLAGPEARYEQRESIELAFIAALQLLPPRQRAVLILRDVLGFSGAEVAEALDTTPASVYSALQRAHATMDERRPDRTQQATLRGLGDEQLKGLVARYVDAWASNDVDMLVGMLTDTATLAMPPIPSWYRGREAIERVLRDVVFDGTRSWRMVPTAANAQIAVRAYELDGSGVYAPHGVTVLTFRNGLIDEISHFRTPSMVERFGLPVDA
jgi:RNA polymerase sigma-70 factor (ECF subfamily)